MTVEIRLAKDDDAKEWDESHFTVAAWHHFSSMGLAENHRKAHPDDIVSFYRDERQRANWYISNLFSKKRTSSGWFFPHHPMQFSSISVP